MQNQDGEFRASFVYFKKESDKMTVKWLQLNNKYPLVYGHVLFQS
jgi:hypothetical protein